MTTSARGSSSCNRGISDGVNAIAALSEHAVKTMATSAASTAHSAVSARCSLTMCVRPAPSANRMAISRARAARRAIARLATLAQTSKSRQNTAPNTSSYSVRLERSNSSLSGTN
jgi:hypothetical protein